MKVKVLIKKLLDCNPEATVFETLYPHHTAVSLDEIHYVVEDNSKNFVKLGGKK